MALKPLRPCRHIGCKELTRKTYCELHQRNFDEMRGNSAKRGYDYSWRKYRITFLIQNPFCVRCKAEGKMVPATVVDHIIPHKGDKSLFWDSKNHQALCKRCHDIKTVTEDGGFGKNLKKYPPTSKML